MVCLSPVGYGGFADVLSISPSLEQTWGIHTISTGLC